MSRLLFALNVSEQRTNFDLLFGFEGPTHPDFERCDDA